MRTNRRVFFRDLLLVETDDPQFAFFPHGGKDKLFCPVCGTVWGSVEGSFRSQWFVASVPCELHGTAFTLGGSFLSTILPHLITPIQIYDHEKVGQFLLKYPTLLAHEFRVHAIWAKKFGDQ